MRKITFLGCFEIHAGQPHWEGIKWASNKLGLDAEFIDTRRHKQTYNGDVCIACQKDCLAYMGDFKKKIWWHCDYEKDDIYPMYKDRYKLDHIFTSYLTKYSEFLPQGCRPSEYIDVPREKDIVFVGGNDTGIHKNRTEFLEQLGVDFIKSWDLDNVYSKYKIAISMNFNEIYGFSNRAFLIQGHSGFCLSKDNPLMRKVFDNVVYFDDIDDAKRKINYYLTHNKEREDIRYKQWEEIQQKHLYTNRLTELLKYV